MVAERPPTSSELALLAEIHRAHDRMVLTPVMLNGQLRYALAFMYQQGEDVILKVVAFLPLDSDSCNDPSGSALHRTIPVGKHALN
jgi:hypothetical protein